MTSTRKHFDVIVVGGRVAGAATAMLFAREGARVLVLERAQYGSDTLSTHALMRAGVMQLARWGVLDDVIAAGTPAVARTTFHFRDSSLTLDIKPGHGFDALYAPRRTVLDALLVDAAWEAGADIRFGQRVESIRHDETGRVRGVEGRDAHGRRFEHGADLVVGADGLHSSVARAVDAPTRRRGRFAMATIFGYWHGVETDGYEWIYRPDASAGLIPTNDGEVCVFVGMRPARFAEMRGDVAGAYRTLLAQAAPDFADRFAGARPPERLRSFPGARGHVRQAGGPGWALVGDAGYYKDPGTAHGITDALRDAELLVRAVTTNEHQARALERFEHERNALSSRFFAITDAIASYLWSDEEIQRLLYALSASMRDEVECIDGLDAARSRDVRIPA